MLTYHKPGAFSIVIFNYLTTLNIFPPILGAKDELGISFWYLGSRAEKIWLLGEGAKSSNQPPNNSSHIP
jgi:hypothetical protein